MNLLVKRRSVNFCLEDLFHVKTIGNAHDQWTKICLVNPPWKKGGLYRERDDHHFGFERLCFGEICLAEGYYI